MLRLKILASSLPLILAGLFAQSELTPGSRPCISVGDSNVQLAAAAWQAQLYVGFTQDPASATVRVQIVDGPEQADFAVVDDDDTPEATSCEVTAATRFIAIARTPSSATPKIYLSSDGDADYRIYVRSRSLTVRDIAALVVGAHEMRLPHVNASL